MPTKPRRKRGKRLVNDAIVVFLFVIAFLLVAPAMNLTPFDRRTARVALEVGGLRNAIELLRFDFGEYPPDFRGSGANDCATIDVYLEKRFRPHPINSELNPTGLDPAEALVFWLSRLGDDPTEPLTGPTSTPFFEFDTARLRDKDADGHLEYYPHDHDAPYVYCFAGDLATSERNPSPIPILNGQDHFSSYQIESQNEQDSQPEVKPQVICAGLDGDFGNGGVFPIGIGYHEGDEDNITSFSEGSTLKCALP